MSENELKFIFSKNLKEYLRLKRKTQSDLVNDLGLKSSTVSDWCTGTKFPRSDKIEMLASYFNIEKSDLIIDSSDMVRNPAAKTHGDDYESFGGKVTELRQSKSLTQSDASEKLNIPQSTYAGYETGTRKIPLSMIKEIASFYEVSVDYLLSDNSNKSVTLAAHRTDGYDTDLPEEAQKELDNYIEYLKIKYKKK